MFRKERLLPFHSSGVEPYKGDPYSGDMYFGVLPPTWRGMLVAVGSVAPLLLPIKSCVVILLSWCTVPSARRMGSLFLIFRRQHSRDSEWEGSRMSTARSRWVSCSLAYRHESVSLVGIRRCTLGMAYLLRTTLYSGHCRSSGAEVFYEYGCSSPRDVRARRGPYLGWCGHC